MIELCSLFQSSEAVVRWLWQGLPELPPAVRPTHFGPSEGRFQKDDRIDDAQKFRAFAEKNPFGFFLFGSEFSIDVSPQSSRPQPSITFWSKERKERQAPFIPHAVEILIQMRRLGSLYGYACHTDEYEHRNRVKAGPFGEVASVEYWVGRDLHRYLPGLYWLNLLTPEMMERHDLDVTELVERLSANRHCAGDSVILQLYPNPWDWLESNALVERVCATTAGIFSKTVVDLRHAANEEQVDALVAQWP